MSDKNGDNFTFFLSSLPFFLFFLLLFYCLLVIIRARNVTLIEIVRLDIVPIFLILGGMWSVFLPLSMILGLGFL